MRQEEIRTEPDTNLFFKMLFFKKNYKAREVQ